VRRCIISVRRRALVTTGIAVVIGATVLWAHAITGPSSSASPYILRAEPGVVSASILTVGDSVGGYRLVGIPDGLGAFDNGDGTFTLLMNHEIGGTLGISRAHGARGAFVSKWIIRKETREVIHGEDLIQQIVTWNPSTRFWNAPEKGIALSRLCSADLPPVSALYDAKTGLGYAGRIFFNGEETSPSQEGRVFAHLMDGTSYELPSLGKASWENLLAHPGTGTRTVVIGLDDSSGAVSGQVYIYVGEKTQSANPVEAAGLTHGLLFGVQVSGVPNETASTALADDTPFTAHLFGDVSAMTGAEI